MNTDLPVVPDTALAYDRISSEYDAQVQGSQWMRSVLWDIYQRLFKPGQRVLDLACGTGNDALFLAQLGVQVVGIDISPGMIERLEHKARSLGLADSVAVTVQDIRNLESWSTTQSPTPFDGIISAYAGLNTLPDLAPLADAAAHLLKPKGYFVAHMLNRCSIWSWLDQIRRGRWQEARRVSRQDTITVCIGGIPVTHYRYYPEEAYQRFFAQHFVLRRACSLGCIRPPEPPHWFSDSLLHQLGRLEQRLSGRYPFINWGQFFVLETQKRNAG